MTKTDVVNLYIELKKSHPILKRWRLKIGPDSQEKVAYVETFLNERIIRVEPHYLSKTPVWAMRIHLLHELGHVYTSKRLAFSSREAHDQVWYNMCRRLGWDLEGDFLVHKLLAPKTCKWKKSWKLYIRQYSWNYYIPYGIQQKANHK